MCLPHMWMGDIELVAVLVNIPCSYKIFKETLAASRPAVIEYALAFIDDEDEERAEILVTSLPEWESGEKEDNFVIVKNGVVKKREAIP